MAREGTSVQDRRPKVTRSLFILIGFPIYVTFKVFEINKTFDNQIFQIFGV